MKKTITSRLYIPIEVTFTYEPSSTVPVKNIERIHHRQKDVLLAVDKGFEEAVKTVESWCIQHAEPEGWERPWTLPRWSPPPLEVRALFNYSSFQDLIEAENSK